MLFILCLLAVAFALFTSARYIAYLLSNGVDGKLSEIRAGVGSLTIGVLRSMFTALAGDALVAATFPTILLPQREGGDGTPVLMVHGLYHNRTAWLLFSRRMRRAGFANLHTYGYNSYTKDFDHAMHGMRAKLDELLGDDPEARVILVGHSLGGLICRCAAGEARYRDRVAGLVTLGSPHRGSELALVGCNRMARDLIPGRYIASRVAESPDPVCPRLGIYTLVDDYVFPLDMLRTGRPGWVERVCPPMSHVWMLYSPTVAAMATGFLRESDAGG